MNSLLLLPVEVSENGEVVLSGGRADYAYSTHGVRHGQSIQVAVLGGMRGHGTVLSASTELVTLRVELDQDGLLPIPVAIIVGVSRPQTIKKVVQSAVMFGVSALHFVRSERGEKSYLQSRSLDPDQIQEETIKALEQVWNSRSPEICVHRSFNYFIEHVEPKLSHALPGEVRKLVAHPGAQSLGCSDNPCLSGGGTVIAIGPERGWSDQEVERFKASGFSLVGLGERVVRVELALVFLLGQLALARGCRG